MGKGGVRGSLIVYIQDLVELYHYIAGAVTCRFVCLSQSSNAYLSARKEIRRSLVCIYTFYGGGVDLLHMPQWRIIKYKEITFTMFDFKRNALLFSFCLVQVLPQQVS